MKRITEQEFSYRMKTIKEENKYRERLAKIKAEKNKGRKKHKLLSMSKLILLGVILLCTEIVIFCEYAMLTLYDASAMYALIGIPAVLAPTIWGYYSKSRAENTQGGITYETAMEELRLQNQGANSEQYDNNADDESVG